ncbi:hypothetical protein [Micromonospora sp. GCM10011541]|uniref:hypothetical protein n=1 Tax=Micromonospora sp. GCM10011541 TaxID=3317336 RepID=UPI00366B8898
MPVQLVRESLASCHFRTLHTTQTWLPTLVDAVAGMTASTDDMTADQDRTLPPENSMSNASAMPEPSTGMVEDGDDSMSRCRTSLLYKIRKGHPEDPEWPLTCVGTAGFEPTTP